MIVMVFIMLKIIEYLLQSHMKIPKNIDHTLVAEPGDLVKYDVDDRRIYIGTDEDVSNDENDTVLK